MNTVKIVRCGQSAGKSWLTPQRLHAGLLTFSPTSLTAVMFVAQTSCEQFLPVTFHVTRSAEGNQAIGIPSWKDTLPPISLTVTIKVVDNLSRLRTISTPTIVPGENRFSGATIAPKLTTVLLSFSEDFVILERSISFSRGIPTCLFVTKVVRLVVRSLSLLVPDHKMSRKRGENNTLNKDITFQSEGQDEDIVQPSRRREVPCCFKGSSAILNATLTLLNERVIKFGRQTINCPLQILVGASNEVPTEQEELGALFDRFLFRKHVRPVPESGRRKLLARAVANDFKPPVYQEKVTPEELDQARQEASQIPWSGNAKKTLWKIISELEQEGVTPGDRRIVKCVGAARASAYLAGATEVLPEHLEVLQHVLWVDPATGPKTASKVVLANANPDVGVITGALQEMTDVLGKNTPIEAAPRLQEIQGRLQKLSPSPRRDSALSDVEEALKTVYRKTIGAPIDD